MGPFRYRRRAGLLVLVCLAACARDGERMAGATAARAASAAGLVVSTQRAPDGEGAPADVRRVGVARIVQRPPAVPRPGLYGERAGGPRTDHRPYLVPRPDADQWRAKPFAHLVSELSPAVLYRSERPTLTFFHGIEQWGLGGPTHWAFATGAGVRTLARGDRVAGATLTEPWVLVWFAGAAGWRFDVPWLIVLQHRAASIRLSEAGLGFEFDGPAGLVAAMPFYGYYKVPPPGQRWSSSLPGAIETGIDTSGWAERFPPGVAARAAWWTRVLRKFPVRLHESFRVDRGRDVLTVRSEVEFLDVADDWGTPAVSFAPLPPTLALALADGHSRFPMRVSDEVTDPFVMTPHGPYMGVEGRASYEIEFDTLQYIHEAEGAQPLPSSVPALAGEAYERLQSTARRRWRSEALLPVDHGEENFAWAAMSDQWYPAVLPHLADPRLRANAARSLQRYMVERVLQEERFTNYLGPARPYRDVLLLHGPGVASWGEFGDAGKFSENLYGLLWSYAHFTGDVETLVRRWPLVKKLDITPLESGWKGVGRHSIAEQGDEAAPPIRYARLAWLVGDLDTYYYQCYIATRELLHLFVKQNGASYFRRLQPYHEFFDGPARGSSIEAIPADVFLTNLRAGLAGWQIDGPAYPRDHGERQYANRWVRFSDDAVARFLRETVDEHARRRELDELQRRFTGRPGAGAESQWVRDDPHIMPSLVRLRSWLLDPTLAEIAPLATFEGKRLPFEAWRLTPDAAVFASALAILRLAQPRRLDRLVPASGEPGPWVLGLERSIESQWSVLVQELDTWDASDRPAWPVAGWRYWAPPRQPASAAGRGLFAFGAVTPHLARPPRASSGWTQLNWNTYVVWYDD